MRAPLVKVFDGTDQVAYTYGLLDRQLEHQCRLGKRLQ